MDMSLAASSTLKDPMQGRRKKVQRKPGIPIGEAVLDTAQTGMQAAGMYPGVGNVVDVANSGVSVARAGYHKVRGEKDKAIKHAKNAALNAAMAIPVAGIGVAGTTLAAKGYQAGRAVQSAGTVAKSVTAGYQTKNQIAANKKDAKSKKEKI